MSRSEIVEWLINLQAELQRALSIHRIGSERCDHHQYVERRMQASLAMQHELLAGLGHPMAEPTQMPENWIPA